MGCPNCQNSLLVIKKGYFQRKNAPAEKRQRFLCKGCKSWFSQTSGFLDEGQGELKAGGRDRLQCRLDLYVGAHNVMIDLKREGAARRDSRDKSKGSRKSGPSGCSRLRRQAQPCRAV